MYPSKELYIWGVKPALDGSNARKWQSIEPDDKVVFYRRYRLFASAIIKYKDHNKRLAEMLWVEPEDGEDTWEYIYFIDDIESQDIEYDVVRGFNVLSPEESLSLLDEYDL